MGNLNNIFGSGLSAAARKILEAMELFTGGAFLLVPGSDYERDDMRRKRVLVFLFGAIDALIQHHHVTGSEMFNTLTAYLSQTFPGMAHSDIENALSFLGDASADPAWVPIMQRGGQAMVDWSRGDSTAPSRLFKVVHYGIDDHEPIGPLARSDKAAGTPLGKKKLDRIGYQAEIQAIHDIGRAIVVATTNSCDAIKGREIISLMAEQAFLKAAGLKNSKFLEVIIFNEFMYFYIFMTTREARTQNMHQPQFQDLRDLLVTSLSKVSVASYFDDWSYELKEKIVAEFYGKLHDAEREYDQSVGPGSTEQEQVRALFSKIGSDVSQLCSAKDEATVARPVSEIAKHEWMGMEMQRRIAETKRAYREHSPPQ